jgi:leucine dehydrogenase
LKILDVSEKEDVPCNEAANLLSERRVEAIRKIKGSYLGNLNHRFPGRKTRNH